MAWTTSKTLKTRLQLKYDSHEQWMENDPVLLAGEVALSTVSVKQEGTVNEVPSVLIKVGDGTSKYSELDFTYAKAADVLSACKTEAGLTAFINNVIADAGIATSDAMEALAGRVTAVEGKTTALEGLVGEKSVATQISEAIAALDLANTYEAKGEAAKVSAALETYKGTNDAKVLENTNAISANTNAIDAIKDGETIDSFADVESALAGKEAAGAAAQALIDAKAYTDGKAGDYDAAGAAKAVQDDLDAYKTSNDAAVGKALTDAKDYTDAEIAEWVGTTPVADQITAAVAGKADTGHKHVKADITDFEHTHEIGEVNGLQDALDGKQAAGDYATKAEAQGYADAKDAAIAAAKKAGDDAQAAADKAQGEVDAVELRVDAVEADIATLVGEDADMSIREIANAELAAQLVPASAKESLDTLQEIAAWIQSHPDDASAMNDKIAALEGKVGDTAVSAQITAAINALKSGDLATMQAAIDDAEAAIETLEEMAHEHANSTVLDGITADKVAAWDKVSEKANDADLAVIAKTGNVNDLVQTTEEYIVLDCGSSSTVI